jgi:hypothetical protein
MVGVVGLAGLFGWVAIARAFEFSGPNASLCALLACGVPMVLWSLLVDKVHRNPSTVIDWDAPPRPLSQSFDISLVKIAGLWTTWAAIGFLGTLPFFATSGSMTDMIRNTALLAIVSGMYYWRAKTEERHLSADSAYREYAEWMERNGPLSRLIRKLLTRPAPNAVPAE